MSTNRLRGGIKLRNRIPCMLLLGAGAVWAATPEPAAGRFSFHEMNVLGTSLDLTVCTAKQADADAAHKAVIDEVERLRKALSTYDATSDLAKVNATRDPVKVSIDVIAVLRQYGQWMTNTNGAYSGRIGELVNLWKKAEKDNKLPTADSITAVLAEMKKPLWKIDDTAMTVQRLSDATINVDSLGKGFIVSKAAAAANEKVSAVRGLMLNIGGDVTVIGTSSLTATEAWAVAVADPAHPAENATPLTLLNLTGMSVATSGGYERGYTIEGKTYSHILNPLTGYPVDFGKKDPKGVAQATVVAKDNGTANALAGALNVMTTSDGMALVNATPGVEAMLVLNDGTEIRSHGFKPLEDARFGNFPAGLELDLTVQINAGRERPYVAVWIENAQGQVVTTLAEWGNNGKYIRSLSGWSRATGGSAPPGVTRATRPAGSYKLAWDGKDINGQFVPEGSYKVSVEYAYEHMGHSMSSGAIDIKKDPATGTVRGTQHFGDMLLSLVKTK